VRFATFINLGVKDLADARDLFSYQGLRVGKVPFLDIFNIALLTSHLVQFTHQVFEGYVDQVMQSVGNGGAYHLLMVLCLSLHRYLQQYEVPCFNLYL
jgi:hypothetical protein